MMACVYDAGAWCNDDGPSVTCRCPYMLRSFRHLHVTLSSLSHYSTCTMIYCFGKRKYLLVLTGQKIIPKRNICRVLFCFCQSNESLCKSGHYARRLHITRKPKLMKRFPPHKGFCERRFCVRGYERRYTRRPCGVYVGS